MPPPLKLAGKRFGKLVVIGRAESQNNKTRWVVQCDCGVRTIKLGSHLTGGDTKSCGCQMNASRFAGSRIPKKGDCHPFVIDLFKRINAEQTMLDEVATRAGVATGTLMHWRTRRSPRLADIEAVINAMGGRLKIDWGRNE
jgi:DNA-binding phage protein